jgi:hypothetical protein
MQSKNRTTVSIARKLEEGRGTGHGSAYRPWLTVQEVRSNGYVSRIAGWKTKRQHEFFSNIETDYFYLLEWSKSVIDIREQFPLLPLEETLKIAADCGYEHPRDPRTKAPIVMTTDFRISGASGITRLEYARTIKPQQMLSSRRVLEKFEIERRYWNGRGVSWGIVTENDIPEELVRNVQWVHRYHDRSSVAHVNPNISRAISKMVAEFLETGNSLSAAALAADDRIGLAAGTSLSVVRHLIATREWQVDMLRLIQPAQPLKILNVQSTQTGGG